MKLDTLITECTAYDYKVTLEEKKPKSWLKSVSAFANGSGGSLFFGVDNGGSVQGLDDVQHVCEAISSRIRDYMDKAKETGMTLVDGEKVSVPGILVTLMDPEESVDDFTYTIPVKTEYPSTEEETP